MDKELAGKVFLVTGATEGIGKAAALEFAKRGATVVLVGRNPEKSQRVLADLKAQSGNEQLGLVLGDLSSLVEVRKVAAAFKEQHQKLDVLVNNAGAVFNDHQLSVDGFEMTFALNHLGYFLLTHLLMDVLRATPGARVVSTSSDAHATGRLKLDTVATRPNGGAGFGAYGDSKLANILFTRSLAEKFKGSGVTANCFHPGFVQSGFGQNNPGVLAKAIAVGAALFARTPQKGAETLIWLATSPDAARFNGEYFHDQHVARTIARAKDPTLAAGLWSLSEKLCGV